MINTRKAMENLFVSRVRIKLMQHFLSNQDIPIHLRAAVREMKEEINAVRRELNRLEEIKILKSETRGNRKYYMLNKQGPFVDELTGIVYKTFGLGGDVIRNQQKLGDVSFAILSDSYMTGVVSVEHHVDLTLIGDVNMKELQSMILETEKREDREINYTVLKLSDFETRKKRRDGFVMDLLLGKKLMLIGSYEELIS